MIFIRDVPDTTFSVSGRNRIQPDSELSVSGRSRISGYPAGYRKFGRIPDFRPDTAIFIKFLKPNLKNFLNKSFLFNKL